MDTGATPRRRVAWACTCHPSAMPIEASQKGGSLPSTRSRAQERGSRPTTISPLPTYGGVCRRRQTVFGCTYASLSHVHSPIRVQDLPPGSHLERHVVKPSFIVPGDSKIGGDPLARPIASEGAGR